MVPNTPDSLLRTFVVVAVIVKQYFYQFYQWMLVFLSDYDRRRRPDPKLACWTPWFLLLIMVICHRVRRHLAMAGVLYDPIMIKSVAILAQGTRPPGGALGRDGCAVRISVIGK